MAFVTQLRPNFLGLSELDLVTIAPGSDLILRLELEMAGVLQAGRRSWWSRGPL